jgi:opine dehydrogenase
VTTNEIEEAVSNADIIMVITPSLAHDDIAKACAPYLKDGQIVFLHPGSTFGALSFKQILKKENCTANVDIAESSTLIYATRKVENGKVNVLGIKERLLVAALPAVNSDKVAEMLRTAYPSVEPVENVMVTSMDNTNPIIHPLTTILSTSLIESNKEWLFYWDGVTPSVGSFMEEMDGERLNIARKLGLKMDSLKEQYVHDYNADAPTIFEAFKKVNAYKGVKGQHSLNTRYILEDIPMGLAPFVSFGKKLGVKVERMELIMRLCELILHKDLTSNARTLENLGLGDLSANELMSLIING